jgi:hypothetical protein
MLWAGSGYYPMYLNYDQMKTKMIAGILIAALVAVSLGVAVAQYDQGNGSRYVDADNDGVCDHIGECPRIRG